MMIEDLTDKSELSKFLTAFFIAFDRHCLVYFFIIGLLVVGFGPMHDPWTGGWLILLLGGMVWYVGKAILITSNTAVTMHKNGEPFFKSGGALTEYDSTFAIRIGEAAEAARRRNERSDRENQS